MKLRNKTVHGAARPPEQRTCLRSLVLPSVLLIVLAFGPPAASWLHTSTPRMSSDKGEEFLLAGKPNEAIRVFKAEIKKFPLDRDAYIGLVSAYHQARYKDEVSGQVDNHYYFSAIIDTYNEALEINPNDIILATGLALTFTSMDSYGLEPDFAASQTAWERCLRLRREQYEFSGTAVDKLAMVAPLMSLARIAFARGDSEQGHALLEQALEIHPNSWAATTLLAQNR